MVPLSSSSTMAAPAISHQTVESAIELSFLEHFSGDSASKQTDVLHLDSVHFRPHLPVRSLPAMKFRFPIVIIDEDYRSENTSGLGIRALAQAIEAEGFEVLGATSYGDLSQFAQQQSRASAFILSIDDEEVTAGPDLDPAVLNLRSFISEVRRKNPDVPIYVHGETKTSRHLPNDVL